MKSKRITSLITVLFCLILLSACAGIDLRTAWTLRNIDYLNQDLDVLRLALSLPDGASLDKATLTLQYSEEGNVKLDHSIPFDIISTGREIKRVGFPSSNRHNIILRVPRSHLAEVKYFQETLESAKTLGKSGSATMGVESKFNPEWIKEYCATGNVEFRFTAWILVDEFEGYLPLLDDSEIMSFLKGRSENFCQKT